MNSKPPKVSDQISTLATFKRREYTKKPSFGEKSCTPKFRKSKQVPGIVTYVYKLYKLLL